VAGRAPAQLKGSRELEDPFCGSEKKLGSKAISCAPELGRRHVASPDFTESVESNQIEIFMSGPRLIRDVLALALMLVVLKLMTHYYCCTLWKRNISAIIGEDSLLMLHVSFIIAVEGLRAILGRVTCRRPHHNVSAVHGYLHDSKTEVQIIFMFYIISIISSGLSRSLR
jgi:hypothetical protein